MPAIHQKRAKVLTVEEKPIFSRKLDFSVSDGKAKRRNIGDDSFTANKKINFLFVNNRDNCFNIYQVEALSNCGLIGFVSLSFNCLELRCFRS